MAKRRTIKGRPMSGLKRLCKMYGSIIIQGVEYYWDWVKDEAVIKSEISKEDFAASERKKYETLKEDQ